MLVLFYSDNINDVILDIRAGNPTYFIIVMGDFNITLEDRDSANRNVTQNEIKINARRITKDLVVTIVIVPLLFPKLLNAMI